MPPGLENELPEVVLCCSLPARPFAGFPADGVAKTGVQTWAFPWQTRKPHLYRLTEPGLELGCAPGPAGTA